DQLRPKLVDLRHGQPAVVGDHQRVGRSEPLGQLGDHSLLVLFLHLLTSSNESSPHKGGLAEGGKTSSPIRLDWTSALSGRQLSSATGLLPKPELLPAPPTPRRSHGSSACRPGLRAPS